jgi:hypothetical protein
LTERTVTVTSAVRPANSPATSSVVNSRVSPAEAPTSASSRPSIIEAVPTSYERPVVEPPGTSSPSTVALRSIET